MYQISSLNPDQLHSTISCKRNRTRGVVLSSQGLQKLAQADVLYDEYGNRHTYEKLSERSLLNERTISRILSCEVRVDKRTLKTFFTAFGLCLENTDYATAKYWSLDQSMTSLSFYLNSTVHNVETNFSYQELIELYQRLMQDLRHLAHLLNVNE
ncbi:MAG: hypothetical protein HY785_05740 [Oscillatoriophycideae cyanobacterium NC_groundwater_1537_Pr4_S-0.65um_50_18]|nr:hypothetical protein [Oscillatoriophycideae cyanobacterium NC_groundwater_1537_Pr4_S-0.65um_50_18]